jgi:hypothetical protein
MTFNWVGSAFHYGKLIRYFSITYDDVELVFIIYRTEDEESDSVFEIQRVTKKDCRSVRKDNQIYEEINEVFYIHTDDDFRKKYKHSYDILKFVCESTVVTIGAYNDSKVKMDRGNPYLVCTIDFINILAESVKITDEQQLKDTSFDKLRCIFSKRELAKELLR